MPDSEDPHDASHDQSEVLNGRRPAADTRLIRDIQQAAPVGDDDKYQDDVDRDYMPEVTTKAQRSVRNVEI